VGSVNKFGKERSDGDMESRSDLFDALQAQVAHAPLNVGEVGSMQTSALGEFFLRNPELSPPVSGGHFKTFSTGTFPTRFWTNASENCRLNLAAWPTDKNTYLLVYESQERSHPVCGGKSIIPRPDDMTTYTRKKTSLPMRMTASYSLLRCCGDELRKGPQTFGKCREAAARPLFYGASGCGTLPTGGLQRDTLRQS
jgi:hypothetical protein